jgi:Ca2+-binding RTX toxin-like protein
MATNGNDFIMFEGSLGQLTVTLTNAYTGYEILIDDEYNINTGTYDGMGGLDVLIGTNFGDFLSIGDPVGIQNVKNVEIFIAGDGGDAIQLDSTVHTLGDIQIFGGAGNDILWANIGNDLIMGADGNDILDGGPGHDELHGENDNDLLFGGEGDDYLHGGSGDDILFGGTTLGLITLDKDFEDDITFPDLIEGTDIVNLVPPGTPALGVDNDNLTVGYEATAELTFRDGFAGYNNTLGVYEIGEDGTIENVDVLWANVKTAGVDVTHTIDLPVGEDGGTFGFFIIADGDRVNDGYDGLDITGDGNVSFVYDYGGAGERTATVDDDGSLVSMVYDDGVNVVVLSGPHYHTTPRGETPDINWDGETHALSGLVDQGNSDVLRIGFEDLPNLGDADFEDVLFDLDINEVHIDASETGSDTLIGGLGDDVLYGEGGDDILVIGADLDNAYGGSGADQFVYDVMDGMMDVLHDFDVAEGDVLNITDILEGYNENDDAISDFVMLVDNGDDTEVHVNADGDVGGAFTAIAVVEGGLDDTLANMIDNGSLVVDQSVVV